MSIARLHIFSDCPMAADPSLPCIHEVRIRYDDGSKKKIDNLERNQIKPLIKESHKVIDDSNCFKRNFLEIKALRLFSGCQNESNPKCCEHFCSIEYINGNKETGSFDRQTVKLLIKRANSIEGLRTRCFKKQCEAKKSKN